jgi:hypothetical protein
MVGLNDADVMEYSGSALVDQQFRGVAKPDGCGQPPVLYFGM